jgi:hypothetical protein
MGDPFAQLEPVLRASAERAIAQFVSDSEQLVVLFLVDGLSPAEVFETLDRCIDLYAPVLAARVLDEGG